MNGLGSGAGDGVSNRKNFRTGGDFLFPLLKSAAAAYV